ncbi:MAG TPA: hypothetical protein VGH38_16485 [Bryobacteraceae bacterium]
MPAATREELRARVPFPAVARFEHHGQWVEVYVNPVEPARLQPEQRLTQ